MATDTSPTARKRRRVVRARLRDLPTEILQLVIDYASPLPYFSYRLLRCMPEFKELIDNQHLVLTNCANPEYLRIPKDQSLIEHRFRTSAELENKIQRFLDEKNCRRSDLRLFLEIEDTREVYFEGRRASKESLVSRFFKIYQKGMFTYTIFPRLSSLPYGASFDFPSKTKLSSRSFSNRADNCVIIELEGLKDLCQYSTFLSGHPFKIWKASDGVELNNSGHTFVTESYLQSKNYVWSHTLSEIRTLSLSEMKHTCMKLLEPRLLLNLSEINLFEIGGVGKYFNVKHWDLPNLVTLRLIATRTNSFIGNKLPALKSLIIEETVLQSNIELSFKNNTLPSMVNLSICTHLIQEFHSNFFNEDLEKVRLDTSLAELTGDVENFHRLISSCKALIISVREDRSMMNLLFQPIQNFGRLEYLALVDSVDADLLNIISRQSFMNLKVLRIYCCISDSISEELNVPSLERLYLLDSKIKSISLRNLNPNRLEKITFDDAILDRRPFPQRNPSLYVKSNGLEPQTTFDIPNEKFVSLSDELYNLYQIKVDQEVKKVGLLHLQYHKRESISGGRNNTVGGSFIADFSSSTYYGFSREWL